MWTRRQLKTQAREVLKSSYGGSLLVIFIKGLILSILSVAAMAAACMFFAPRLIDAAQELLKTLTQIEYSFANLGGVFADVANAFNDFFVSNSNDLMLIGGIMLAFCAVFYVFFGSVFCVGLDRWFSRNRESYADTPIRYLFGAFNKHEYCGTVRGMFWRNLWALIWSLLAIGIVPLVHAITIVYHHGFNSLLPYTPFDLLFNPYQVYRDLSANGDIVVIVAIVLAVFFHFILTVKIYSYRMQTWILADNPQLGARRALRLSKNMTAGQKWRIFLLDLSFLPWFLLCAVFTILAPLALFLLSPYILATQAELYALLRDLAVKRGLVTMEQLGYQRVA